MPPAPFSDLFGDGLERRAATATNRLLPTLHATTTLHNTASSRAEPTLPPGPSYRPTTTATLKYNPGLGAKLPQHINNKAIFSLFALVGVAMVVGGIWFFFWAKNGGFVWQKGDWDEYKSTVLRRKGKDGKTLSGATKTTDLGQQSIAGTFDIERDQMSEVKGYTNEKYTYNKPNRPRGQKQPSDEDVRAYRKERPARVGGLNREFDGSQFEFTNESRSSVISSNSQTPLRPKPVPVKKGFVERRREKLLEKRQAKQAQKAIDEHKKRIGRRNSLATADHTTVTDDSEYQPNSGGAGNGYYSAYRPRGSPQRSPRHANSPRQGSPRKQPRPSQRPPGGFDAYSEASGDTGTKSYPHHIPELGRNSGQAGYRRDRLHNRTDSFDDDERTFRRH